MALRNIRPSSNFSEASTSARASALSQSTSTSESPGSDPRHPLQPGGDRDKDRRPGDSGSSGSIPKRRRVPDSITRNACMNCKRARAKCDGKAPCSRCEIRSENSSCIYEVHIKHAKEELVKQITDLRAKDRQNARIYKALQSESLAEEVFNRLRNGEAHDAIAEWLDRTAPADLPEHDEGYSPVPAYPRTNSPSEHELSEYRPLYWTKVVCEESFIEHLFRLYLCWIHPVQTILSERHFLESFQNKSNDFCSSLLVNAICALACGLHINHHDKATYEVLSKGFVAAFKEEFNPSDKRVTTIQATAIMFQLEVSSGKSARANGYLKLATESIREAAESPAANTTHPVFKATIDGIRFLVVEWAQATFQPPPFLDSRSMTNASTDDEDLDAKYWHFYRFQDDQTPMWPSMLRTVNEQKMKLINIINDICVMMYGPSPNKITAQHILEQYARLRTWHDILPPKLGVDFQNKSQALPHVLSLLILYNHSVTQLLRPLNDLKDFPPFLVEEAILTHAQRGLYLIDQQYRKHFTCRYLPALQLFVVSNLCDMVARYYPNRNCATDKDGGEALFLGLEVLQESHANNAGFPVGGVLRELLRQAPFSYSAPLTMPAGANYPIEHNKYTYEDFMDVSTRAVYFQPTRGVRERFEQDLTRRWLAESPRFGLRRPVAGDRALRVSQNESDRDANYLMQIKNLLNESS